MKIKTNVRAGKNGADDVVDTSDTSSAADTSTSSSNQKQKGKASGGGATVVYTVYSRCTGA